MINIESCHFVDWEVCGKYRFRAICRLRWANQILHPHQKQSKLQQKQLCRALQATLGCQDWHFVQFENDKSVNYYVVICNAQHYPQEH